MQSDFIKLSSHQYAKIGRIISTMHPDLVSSIIRDITPKDSDTKRIVPMYNHFCGNHDPVHNHQDKILFIASVLSIFCPIALNFNTRVTDRVCMILTEAMGYNHRQSISYFIGQSRAYMKIATFRDKVGVVTNQLKEVA